MAVTEEERQQILWLLSPWLIGSCIDFLLQGILFSQFARYYSAYKDDKFRLRIIVTVLLIATTLKSIQAFVIVWHQHIERFADVPGAVISAYTFWAQSGNGLMVASIGLYVQLYFLARLYLITHRWHVVIPIGIVLLFAYVGMILATYYSVKADTPNIGLWCTLVSSAEVGRVFSSPGDALLCGATAYALLTSTGRHALKQTSDLIHRLVQLTWQTITPAALCALLNLIFSQLYNGEEKLVSAAFNMALPKLYAISMMWTLNARRSIRYGTSSGNITSTGEMSGRTRRREDIELGHFGTIGTIHIRTDVETLQYTENDVNDPAFVISKGRVSPVPSRRSEEASSSFKGAAV